MKTMPPTLFSIIIPSRNRASLCARALQSVRAQHFDRLEIILVVDGSTPEELAAYRELATRSGPTVTLLELPHREQGHGPSFARNEGVSAATGTYVGFLDDDDEWTDPEHLGQVNAALEASGYAIQAYFTNQIGVFADGSEHPGPLWLSALATRLGDEHDARGCYSVNARQLLSGDSFAHLNCSIYRRDIFSSIGGFDETLRYEEDRDLFLRMIDAAQDIRYHPSVVARHFIPEPARKDNVTTNLSALQKQLGQLRVFDKAITFSHQTAVRDYARRAKTYTLKHLGRELENAGRDAEALAFMRQALATSFSFKWLAYILIRWLRSSVRNVTR